MKHYEDAFHKQIANYLNYVITDENDFFTYLPFGEKRNITTGALLKAKGTKRGVPDFLIIKRNGNISTFIWIEAKVGKNKQSTEQIDFQDKIKKQQNEFYFVVYNLEEVIEIIENYYR